MAWYLGCIVLAWCRTMTMHSNRLTAAEVSGAVQELDRHLPFGGVSVRATRTMPFLTCVRFMRLSAKLLLM